jgi:hypothetical protein
METAAARTKEAVAFFLIAGAALSFLVFANGLRSLIGTVEPGTRPLSALAWGGAVATATLLLAGNAVSRAPAFAAMDDELQFDPNTRRFFEDAGLLLLASGALAAIALVVAVSLAAIRYGILPRWLGWAGFAVAPVLLLGIAFVGFLGLMLWVLAVSAVLGFRRAPATAPAA